MPDKPRGFKVYQEDAKLRLTTHWDWDYMTSQEIELASAPILKPVTEDCRETNAGCMNAVFSFLRRNYRPKEVPILIIYPINNLSPTEEKEEGNYSKKSSEKSSQEDGQKGRQESSEENYQKGS